jgi:hypothetical protein
MAEQGQGSDMSEQTGTLDMPKPSILGEGPSKPDPVIIIDTGYVEETAERMR